MRLVSFRFPSLILAAAALAGVLLVPQVQAHDHGHAPGQSEAKAAAAATAAAPLDAHTLADVERHRAMARAHEGAAQCLAKGGAHEKCEKQLQADCKGLALGKYCGMRHAH